ncbi:Zn finger protein HypA/HybF [Halanaeroarchaeum sp. HSR-CO]|uniref:hydrogenase maturation nickel metallochaperone HypA/HybF n=1 Tax=Halanaeroarchaeum sp. HSR-CO TaxID=2866382 RepID=UPI00217F0A9B|nr:hydrogenase maturation nickel metallochaperone HypA [Halanaeroarchaeum sp. HSR-CO]UWG47168.1 Zn finger protein HypA/HybF [Halanaeroarchaeum sp. HSR-CO]
MHEVSLARALVDRAREAAQEHDAERVDAMTVAVGEATHINPEQLVFTIETVARDTIAADATIEIETVAPVATCACGWEGEPGTLDSTYVVAPNVTCPECGERLTFAAGRECELRSIAVPDDPAATNRTER